MEAIQAALFALVATPTYADCPFQTLKFNRMDFSAVPTATNDLSLRPVNPECVRGIRVEPMEDKSRLQIYVLLSGFL